ncbi:MAG TPA: GNAT family N-acetyltransferase [Myxococcaceae bacterium]|nr:GNAT family N-acetyltransferase [Myxococcaceae bacterium]
MDFLATARRLEAIQGEAVRDLASESEPIAGGWMAANGTGSYLNKAVGMGFEAEPSADHVERVERFFASRQIEPRIELTAFAPVAFLRRLAERGFVLQEFEHTLVLPVDDGLAGLDQRLPAGWPRDVRIEPLDPTDSAQVHAFVLTSASGFLSEGERIPDTYLETGVKAARAPDHHGFLAYVGDQVAGAAGASYRRGVMSLFGTSVLPPFRRRGIQQALIAARLGRALSLQADLASITSHPGIPTERNAARLGFQLAYVRAVMVKRGPGLVPSP